MHSSCICSLKPATINCKLLMTTLSSAAHLCNLPLALLTCLVYPYPPHQTEQFMIFQLGKNSPKDFHGIGRGMSQNWDKRYKGVVCTFRHTREQTYWHKDLKLTLRRKDNWLSLLQLDFMSTSDCAKIVCSFEKVSDFSFEVSSENPVVDHATSATSEAGQTFFILVSFFWYQLTVRAIKTNIINYHW